MGNLWCGRAEQNFLCWKKWVKRTPEPIRKQHHVLCIIVFVQFLILLDYISVWSVLWSSVLLGAVWLEAWVPSEKKCCLTAPWVAGQISLVRLLRHKYVWFVPWPGILFFIAKILLMALDHCQAAGGERQEHEKGRLSQAKHCIFFYILYLGQA